MTITFQTTQANIHFDGRSITMQKFIKGTTTKISVEFISTARAFVDPTAVTLSYKLPDLTTTSILAGDITKDAIGKYSYTVTLAQSGFYNFQWVGTGANGGVQEANIWVKDSEVV